MAPLRQAGALFNVLEDDGTTLHESTRRNRPVLLVEDRWMRSPCIASSHGRRRLNLRRTLLCDGAARSESSQ
jgi:hypothetical protein